MSFLWYIFIFGLFQNSFAQKSYEGAQLLQITYSKINTVLNILTDKYGGVIWKDFENKLDISFEKENLFDVKKYFESLGIEYEILISNLQTLIDYSTPNRTKRTTTMNWSNYQSYDTITSFLYSLQVNYPTIVTVKNIGSTFENRNLLVLRISDNPTTNNAIWLDGGIHAREWISPASVTYIANYLTKNWNSLPTKLKNKTWYLMPVMNPDGYEYSRTNNRLWRKNRKKFTKQSCVGVDLNRNFDVAWDSDTLSSNHCSETYRGINAFSEIETFAVKTFLINNKNLLKAYLSYHSYGQYILWPYGYTKSIQAPNAAHMKSVGLKAASNIKALTGKRYIAARDTLVGIIAGASDDWSVRVLGILYAYTIELRDTGTHGFLLPANQIISTCQEALEMAKTVAKAI